MRKFCLATLATLFCIAVIFTGCKEKDPNNPTNQEIKDIDWDKIMTLPYSSLTPDEQKLKLEQECLDFIDLLDASSSSKAIKALQYLSDLLDQDDPDLDISKKVSNTKEVFEISNVYGIFTWNASKREWTKTNSSSELKFVFPAQKGTSSNNATLSVKAENSGVTYTETWEYYEWETGKYVTYEDTYHLPKSVTAIVSIDNKESAKIEVTAEYKNNKEVPVKQETTITTSEGYTYWYKVEKGDINKVSMKMIHNQTTMFEALIKSDIKVDDIVDFDYDYDFDYNLLKDADAFIRLMDNLMLVYQIDLKNFVKEMDNIDDEYYDKTEALWDNWRYNQNYFVLMGQYEKEKSDKRAIALNKNMTAALVSNKENYKIADMLVKSEKDDEYWDYYQWDGSQWEWDWYLPYVKMYDYYWTNPYLKFNDNTEVEMSVYFSKGFNKLEQAFEDFINSFDW